MSSVDNAHVIGGPRSLGDLNLRNVCYCPAYAIDGVCITETSPTVPALARELYAKASATNTTIYDMSHSPIYIQKNNVLRMNLEPIKVVILYVIAKESSSSQIPQPFFSDGRDENDRMLKGQMFPEYFPEQQHTCQRS